MAAELVGGALLSAFLQVAFEKLTSPQVLDFFHGRKLDEKLLSKMEIKLHSIQALADDAEQKQFRDPHVRNWLLKVKNVVLDAEDVLDEIQYEISKCQVEAESESQTSTGCSCKVPNFFKTSHASSFNKEIKSRIEQVLDSLEFLSSQKGDLGLKNASGVDYGSGSGSEVSQKLPSTSLLSESVIYGRDDDKEMILNWLRSDTEDCNQLSVLSIVGMGGVGKTTLAQHVYNDPRIEGKFDIKAWVCVSNEFDVFKVTRTILDTITKSVDDSRELEMVHGRLKEKLTGNKFLLVLDDVWNENRHKWETVQRPLDCGAQGSRILVTTRSKKVASTMQSKEHHLEQLEKDHCWRLFNKHAFQDDNAQSNPDFKEIGMKIVEKCKGLPLALKTIGSLLHRKTSILEWESILKSKIWEFSEEDSEIVPALALSYHHLPSHLKRCFAYCALFPKDYEFDKECLIQLWMAENFLQCHQQSKSPEEVGEQYFNDLLSRSFFQQSSINDLSPIFFLTSSRIRNKTYFVMHDLLNDLAKYVGGDIYFRLEDDQAKSIPKTARHFSFETNDIYCYDEELGSLHDVERFRTFMPTSKSMDFLYYSWYCKMSIHQLFSKFKFLRVLSLLGCSELKEVPDSVGNLKHLHSLDLSNTNIKKLPESTCSLYNLQILKLNGCSHMKEFPTNFHKLTNLRRLELIKTEVRKVPEQLGKLKNLHVLMSSFDVGKSREFGIHQLGELNLHGRISIGELQNIENPSDALAVDLKNKIHLVEIDLKWVRDQNPDDSIKERDEIVIQNLQPSKHLEKLSIGHYGGTKFPSWLSDNSLSNVVSLRLTDCKYCLCLPRFGLLPFLKDLVIKRLDGIVSIDADFYGNNSSSFTSLETLKFSAMKEWEKWECQAVTGAFPRLQRLSIKRCPKLKGHLPEQLLHLKRLDIEHCEQLVASSPISTEIRELNLKECGKLQFDFHPTTLKKLTICGYIMEASMLERIGHITFVTSLEYLYIYNCLNMNIPMTGCYNFLVSLSIINGCDSLTTFPLDFFPKLEYLFLRGCRNLHVISQGLAHNHLKDLVISECAQFEALPERMHALLPYLDVIQIDDCPKFESFPNRGLPSNLKKMYIDKCSKLIMSLKEALGGNLSLETLGIGLDMESFPDEGLLPLSLTSLCIYNSLNLKRLDYKGICNLSSLKELILFDCPSLQCLPEEGLPKSISTLKILGNCPLLKERCQKPEGEDWGKIAHIRFIYVGSHLVL
ncbi:putative disease resistance RPP13-like protein 1 [Glycine soja]|nr:putative disease resistance RPP13-like protein 1 [Glycine soja]KHN46955.1 Putative disease resistance RPP13-like protein 1 [Glycine soja]RZC09154.1 putative disease resistance RPP13-like protein 1 [Glycine soja]